MGSDIPLSWDLNNLILWVHKWNDQIQQSYMNDNWYIANSCKVISDEIITISYCKIDCEI